MVEYLKSEDDHRLSHEACDLCGLEIAMPEDPRQRPLHICPDMPIDDERFVAWLKSVAESSGATVIVNALTRSKWPKSLGFLQPPKTVGDLRQWSKWDFRRLHNVSWIRAGVIERALKKAGLPLLDITYQKAAARRRMHRLNRERDELHERMAVDGLRRLAE